jgi:hypothetical protein
VGEDDAEVQEEEEAVASERGLEDSASIMKHGRIGLANEPIGASGTLFSRSDSLASLNESAREVISS